jgi:hypothetical protein
LDGLAFGVMAVGVAAEAVPVADGLAGSAAKRDVGIGLGGGNPFLAASSAALLAASVRRRAVATARAESEWYTGGLGTYSP